MNDLEFSAFLVSRVCHDLVGPLGAVVNGLEVLEDERDAAMRADALKIVTSSAPRRWRGCNSCALPSGPPVRRGRNWIWARSAVWSPGCLSGGKVALHWEAPHVNWPKDWAKLVMNAALHRRRLPAARRHAADRNQPRIRRAFGFKIVATGQGARIVEDVEQALRGEAAEDALRRARRPALSHPQTCQEASMPA